MCVSEIGTRVAVGVAAAADSDVLDVFVSDAPPAGAGHEEGASARLPGGDREGVRGGGC